MRIESLKGYDYWSDLFLILDPKTSKWDRLANIELQKLSSSQQVIKGNDPLFQLFFKDIQFQVASVLCLENRQYSQNFKYIIKYINK